MANSLTQRYCFKYVGIVLHGPLCLWFFMGVLVSILNEHRKAIIDYALYMFATFLLIYLKNIYILIYIGIYIYKHTHAY